MAYQSPTQSDGLFGTSTAGSQLGGAGGLFGNSGGFSNTSAQTSGLFGGPAAAAQAEPVTQYKVIVAGDGGTGKTAWLAKLLGDEFPASYTATLGVVVRPIDLDSVRFSMWDCAGQEQFGGLRDGYFLGAQAAVIFFDLSSRFTFSTVSRWYRDITRTCGDVPVVVVGAKSDLDQRAVALETVAQFVQARGLEYVELSAKEDINTRKPLELLAAKLTNATSAGAPAESQTATTPLLGGSLFGSTSISAPYSASASSGFSWASLPSDETMAEASSPFGGGGGGGGGGLFGGASSTFPISSGGLFGTSTAGSPLGGAPPAFHGGLFGNSGGFSNTSAQTSSLFGGPAAAAQAEDVTQYKVIVAGDGGTGKTAWLAKLLGHDFPTSYVPTLGVAVRSIDHLDSVRFSMWDCAGQERFGGLRDGYFIGAQAAVIFFDLSSRVTFSGVSRWYRDITRVCDNVPVVIVGAKSDLDQGAVAPETVAQFVQARGLEYVELSAKEDINTRKPLELLAERLM